MSIAATTLNDFYGLGELTIFHHDGRTLVSNSFWRPGPKKIQRYYIDGATGCTRCQRFFFFIYSSVPLY